MLGNHLYQSPEWSNGMTLLTCDPALATRWKCERDICRMPPCGIRDVSGRDTSSILVSSLILFSFVFLQFLGKRKSGYLASIFASSLADDGNGTGIFLVDEHLDSYLRRTARVPQGVACEYPWPILSMTKASCQRRGVLSQEIRDKPFRLLLL